MFFSQALLWRKGPVANIWTAAYCFKKLKREQIAQTDIPSSVDQIISDIQISYRILAHLLLGIVRIFSKKVEFLEEDCNEIQKTLRESFNAICWTNPKKSKHVRRKQPTHVPETSDGGTHTGTGLFEALRAHPDRPVISVPARFELDLFDLEIVDDYDAPDTHQQSAPQANNTVDGSDRNLFLKETYQKGSGCRIFSSTCFIPIEDVIPVKMMIDLDLDTTDLYDSTSSRREKTDLNPDATASAEQDMCTEDPNGEAEAVEPSVACHESPLKDKNMISKEKKDAPILENLEIEEPLNVADLPTTDPGMSSPKLMVQTPAKRETARNPRKRKIAWCFEERIILSNKVMRKAIHDPGDLVHEWRKAPRTCLEAWRRKRFSSVDQLFTEPLIPCAFSKVHARASSDYRAHRPDNHNTELETPLKNGPRENASDIVSNVKSPSRLEQSKMMGLESENQESDKETSSRFEKIKRRLFEPETPENGPHERSTSLSDWVCEGLPEGPTPNKLAETSDTTLSSLDSELGSHDGDGGVDQTQESSPWSERTRYVAQCLHKKASYLKKRNYESCLSLEQMLQGKKRKTCAHFFYETLMLKGHGMIDVKQESPYGDIKISVIP